MVEPYRTRSGSDRVNLGGALIDRFYQSNEHSRGIQVGEAGLVNLSRVWCTFDPVATAPGSVIFDHELALTQCRTEARESETL